ncbi:MAG TPA: hypothetical protein VM425_20370 [Myxococcota bacterium]|nr:hypothetical protein [Myxococcota bacterium]
MSDDRKRDEGGTEWRRSRSGVPPDGLDAIGGEPGGDDLNALDGEAEQAVEGESEEEASPKFPITKTSQQG